MRHRHPSTMTFTAITAGLLTLGGIVLGSGTAKALTQAEIANLKGPDRQATLEAGAKKEGAVTMYSAMIVNIGLRPMVAAFNKKYPYLKADFYRGPSRKLLQKAMAEMRADALVADILEGAGVEMPAIQAGLHMSFYSPELDAYPKVYIDPEGRFAATRQSHFATAVNTKSVTPGEVPQTYDDLLDPKWNGKIAWRAGAESGAALFITNQLISRGDKAGETYLRKLSENKVVNYSGSARALVDRVGQGEYPLAVNIFAHHPIIAAGKGAPLDAKMLAPAPTIFNTAVLLKGAPHPHAAMLFLDFMLGKEGQNVLKNAKYFPPHPDVNPVDSLHRVVPKLAKVEGNIVPPTKMFEYRDKANALFDKYFK